MARATLKSRFRRARNCLNELAGRRSRKIPALVAFLSSKRATSNEREKRAFTRNLKASIQCGAKNFVCESFENFVLCFSNALYLLIRFLGREEDAERFLGDFRGSSTFLRIGEQAFFFLELLIAPRGKKTA